MTWAGYLIAVNIYLIILFGFYALFLKNETFFKLNRVYLIGSVFLSFLIPLIRSGFIRSLFITEKVYQAASSLNIVYVSSGNVLQPKQSDADWFLVAYLTGLSVFLGRFILQLIFLAKTDPQTTSQPYSFFRRVFVPDNIHGRDSILKHEKVHVKQWHSADILLLEIAAVINWFNPIILLYKRAIKYTHEFIADETAAKNAASKSDYSLLLLSEAFGVAPSQLSNNFFTQSMLKRRIAMLNKTKSNRTALVKYGFTAPLFLAMLIFSSATIDRNRAINDLRKEINKISASTIGNNIKSSGTDDNKVRLINPADTASQRQTDSFRSLYRFTGKNIIYPSKAREARVHGDIVTTFTISASGNIGEIKVLKGLGYGIEEEVMRALSKVPALDPSAAGNYAFTVSFRLDGEGQPEPASVTRIPQGYKALGPLIIMGYPAQPKTTLSPSGTIGTTGDKAIHDFATVDVLPEFKGGMDAFYSYVSKNFKYPEEAVKNKISGRLIISFVVEEDGSLEDFRVLRDLGYGLGDEALRMLKNSPKWKPGTEKDKPVRVMYTLPIMVNLKGNNNEKVQKQ